jgi:hypothetical protein
MELRE